MGAAGPGTLGAVGGTEPRQRRRPGPPESRPAPEGQDGRPHPGPPARPAGPGLRGRPAAQGRPSPAPGRPPGPARRGVHRSRADAHPLGPAACLARQHLGSRPGRRPAPAPEPRGRARVLGMGVHRSSPDDRLPGRGTDRTQPSQPGPVPAARHRRSRPAAADRAIEDRYGAPHPGLPGAGGRAQRRHLPHPRPQRGSAPGPRPRSVRAHLAAAVPAAVPAAGQDRAPRVHRVHGQHPARRGAGPHRADRPRRRRAAPLHGPRFSEDLHHGRRAERAPAAYRPGDSRASGHYRDHGL